MPWCLDQLDQGASMKPVVFASNPSFWFETLRSFSHTAYGGADFGEVLLTQCQRL
jgi:hypothetical protein